jgi:hypothetical protein
MGCDETKRAKLGDVRVEQKLVIEVQISILCCQLSTLTFKISFVQIIKDMTE